MLTFNKWFKGAIVFLLISSLLLACSPAKETASTPQPAAPPTEVKPESTKITYESHVKDLIASNCLFCHGSDSPTMAEFNEDVDKYTAMMKGPRLDTYENLVVVINGSEAGAFMRRLDDGTNRDDGKPGNMYHNLGKTDEERAENLAMLKEWVGNWSLKRDNELTDEERAAMLVPEK